MYSDSTPTLAPVDAAPPPWNVVRSRVYIRDQGICAVCQRFVTIVDYHCGHVLDHAMGGQDTEENCVVMCDRCNRQKPLHTTYEEAMGWVTSGGKSPAPPRPASDSVTLNLRLPAELLAALKIEAEREDRSVNNLIVKLLRDSLIREA